jgi:hypothetical protein
MPQKTMPTRHAKKNPSPLSVPAFRPRFPD